MSWLQLKAIADSNRQGIAAYNAMPPDACPIDGTPLMVGKDGERRCPLGNYSWRYGQRLT